MYINLIYFVIYAETEFKYRIELEVSMILFGHPLNVERLEVQNKLEYL